MALIQNLVAWGQRNCNLPLHNKSKINRPGGTALVACKVSTAGASDLPQRPLWPPPTLFSPQQMDDDKVQDDIRNYTERRWLRFSSIPYFQVYVLLAISYLLILIYFIAGLSKVSSLSSELSEQNSEILTLPAGLDDQLFPCGPDTRQWEYFNGKCYYFSLETAPWMRAKSRCEEKLSQLVVINSMAEQNFIQTRTRNARYWMGLTDMDTEGVWRWVDGSDYNTGFMHWKPGEPNDDGRNEDCAHLWGNGVWNDVYCTYLCYYVCEKPMPRTARAHHSGT